MTRKSVSVSPGFYKYIKDRSGSLGVPIARLVERGIADGIERSTLVPVSEELAGKIISLARVHDLDESVILERALIGALEASA